MKHKKGVSHNFLLKFLVLVNKGISYEKKNETDFFCLTEELNASLHKFAG